MRDRWLWLPVLVALLFICTPACTKKAQDVVKTIKTMVESPRMVSPDLTVYSLAQAKWAPRNFALGQLGDNPIVAFSAPDGLRIAVGTVAVPQSANDWQVVLLHAGPPPNHVILALSGSTAIVSYTRGRGEERQKMLASCIDSDPEDIDSWSIEELDPALGNLFVWSMVVHVNRLGLMCRDNDDRTHKLLWRDLGIDGAEWEIDASPFAPAELRQPQLLSPSGSLAMGYVDGSDSSLWLAAPRGSQSWSGGRLTKSGATGLSLGSLDFCNNGNTIASVFIVGDPPVLKFAIDKDVTATHPTWKVSDLVSWDMLGSTDIAFNGELPVVAYAADTGIFAFFAEDPAPTGPGDWVMCSLCKDLGAKGYNGIKTLAIDGSLVTVYLATDVSGSTTLDVTVIDIP